MGVFTMSLSWMRQRALKVGHGVDARGGMRRLFSRLLPLALAALSPCVLLPDGVYPLATDAASLCHAQCSTGAPSPICVTVVSTHSRASSFARRLRASPPLHTPDIAPAACQRYVLSLWRRGWHVLRPVPAAWAAFLAFLRGSQLSSIDPLQTSRPPMHARAAHTPPHATRCRRHACVHWVVRWGVCRVVLR